MIKTTSPETALAMAPEQFAVLIRAINLHGENIASGAHAVAQVQTQASASAVWLRDGLESVAAALERIARALEQRPAASMIDSR
ncbi:hypothetical protein [Comamonas flocculans]|uniref:Uncharacterized protein n=1 Tax=Comamonas flocculans TaxID=2597701 RepID=A0A5B8RVZ2_9BURK|nr:hypothetical protein [Comamonas flocculans]QEA13779.1 hypothetical protein FOZ74_12455 [Comamonas flocculans]